MTTTATTRHQHKNYFTLALENPEAFIRKARKALQGHDFDTFVVRGMSGAIAGAMLSRSMKKNLFVIRKDNDDSHDGNKPFGVMGERWLFLDDFISSGETFYRVYDKINNAELFGDYKQVVDNKGALRWRWVGSTPEFVGAYLYRDGCFMFPGDKADDYIAHGDEGYYDQ
jgi:hypothetical protein